MTWPERLLNSVTLAALVLVAVVVTFCAEDATSWRTRMWSLRWRWAWAAEDATTNTTMYGRTVAVTSTRATAILLLRDVIGDL